MANSKGPKRATGSKPSPSSKAGIKKTENRWTSIPIERPFPMPVPIKEVLSAIYAAGHVGYIVGGSVRDFLLNRQAKDHDIATDATPDQLLEIFPKAQSVGKAFGVIRLPDVEIATFRKDLDYVDHRHPTKVKFSTPEEDALRRDFTVNAFYYDPKSQTILDYVGGWDDLKSKTLRVIGSSTAGGASRRFQEDALRLLRAVRFQAFLDFKIEPLTFQAIQHHAKLIKTVSAERARDELTWIWQSKAPDKALSTLRDTGLLSHVLPELLELTSVPQPRVLNSKDNAWDHTLRMLQWLSQRGHLTQTAMAWAAVLWSIGKPPTFKKNHGEHLNGQEIEGAQWAEKICRRMRLSIDEIHTVKALIGEQLKFRDVFNMRESTLQRWIREPWFADLLTLHQADALMTDGNLVTYEFCKSQKLKKEQQVLSWAAEV